MNITVDCDLNATWLHGQSHPALLQLLAKGRLVQHAKPLEALIAEQFGLLASPDYPLAAMAAGADGIATGHHYFLRADPVHLVLQRDCFSLHEALPLKHSREEAQAIIASFNQHFTELGMAFSLGDSGAWYVQLAESPQIRTTLPAVAMGKNIHDFLPQGKDASTWVALLNEVQMLLHEHAVNVSRESLGQLAINSLWFSAGGALPSAPAPLNGELSLMANSAVYMGFAKLIGAPCRRLPERLKAVMQEPASQLHLHLPCMQDLDACWFAPLLQALNQSKFSQLTLNLGFYEQTIQLNLCPRDLYKFWRRPRVLEAYWA